MPLQTSRLHVYTPGVSGDPPPDEVRNQLDDGIHLRWFFERNLGFPKSGFFLFRRRSIDVVGTVAPQRQCLRGETDTLPPGVWPGAFLDTIVVRQNR